MEIIWSQPFEDFPMKTSDKSPLKFLSQKGQSFIEYALLISFVAAIFLFIYLSGGFDGAIASVFGNSGNSISDISYDGFDSSKSSSGGASASTSSDNSSASSSNSLNDTDATSFDYETLTAEDVTPAAQTTPTYKPLNWERDILPFANITYDTIVKSDTVDKALSSEIGLFNTLLAAADGGLASTNAADGTKDWETFLTMVETTKASNNISSSYVRDEQKITVKRAGKDLRITYADKENLYYYKFSPDANNVMQVETNSNKSYGEFFSSVMRNADGGGWKYSE